MFLYLEDKEVKITEAGMREPTVIELWNSDKRSRSKPFFHKCMTYIYFMYKPDGDYKNLTPSRRLEKSLEQAGLSFNQIDGNKRLKAVIDEYIDQTTTLNMRLYEAIKQDVEDIIERIKNVPSTRKVKFETKHTTLVEGKEIEIPIKTWVDVDNWEEKSKAVKNAEQLIDFEDRIRKKVMKDSLIKRSNKRMFDGKSSK